MSEAVYTKQDLTVMQAWTLTRKIQVTQAKILECDKYAEYLRTMSKFHSYSVRNTILIHMQRPDATAVAGFNAWKFHSTIPLLRTQREARAHTPASAAYSGNT